jgi:C4-dicarboxylate-specific signal transduction histidine kinase
MKPVLIAVASAMLSTPLLPPMLTTLRKPDAGKIEAIDLSRLVWLAKADAAATLTRTECALPRRESQVRVMADPAALRDGLAKLMSLSAGSMRGKARKRMDLRFSTSSGRTTLELTDEGTGLGVQELAAMYGNGKSGLSDARRRIERAGGVINVSSQSGAGTVYLIEFPNAG